MGLPGKCVRTLGGDDYRTNRAKSSPDVRRRLTAAVKFCDKTFARKPVNDGVIGYRFHRDWLLSHELDDGCQRGRVQARPR